MVRRRDVVHGGLALAGAVWTRDVSAQSLPPAPAGAPFGPDTVRRLAKARAARPYSPPDTRMPAKLATIDYADYANLHFQADHALWRAQGLPFQVQFFPRGYLYSARIDIFEVADGRARPIAFALDQFNDVSLSRDMFPPDLGFSGFRLHHPINNKDYEEFAVFQGASYFRAVGKGEVYGLSARGLSIGSGAPGEEFPDFRTFWLERPALEATSVGVWALLDSPAATGAFHFRRQPGERTVFDVEAIIYPRRDIANVGLAPMSSMFFLGDINRFRTGATRSPIHDSQGLEIWNGRDERLWRPLDNPPQLEADAFEDHSPKGFGLMQRRRPPDPDDPQAYQRRPDLWVEPRGAWGRGAIDLVDITTTDANADNVTAFWRPKAPLKAGSTLHIAYRLTWGQTGPHEPDLPRVIDSRRSGPDGRHMEIEYRAADGAPLDPAGLQSEISTSAGRIAGSTIGHASGGTDDGRDAPQSIVLGFDLDPGAAPAADLRAVLTRQGRPVSEVWLYRWTR
jgi:glucans biosynthesis protein